MEHQWFQPGDRVRVRQWDDMEREYGWSVRLGLNVPLLFTRGMKQYCGQEFIVTEVWDILVAGERCQRVMGLPAQYQWSNEMLEPVCEIGTIDDLL